MKIIYYDTARRFGKGISNFGDVLNLFLWPRIFPGLFDSNEKELFYGIGTLLMPGIPAENKKYIFGSGARSFKIGRTDSSWHIYFVRGFLTAKAIRVDNRLALTDPAILVAKFFEKSNEPKYKFGFMPHISTAYLWRSNFVKICKSLEIKYIDPTQNVENVIQEISLTKTMLCEAMHAAIVSDALRIPWVPIVTGFKPHKFKWTDWCSSIQLPYQPIKLLNLNHYLKKIGSGMIKSFEIPNKIMEVQLKSICKREMGYLSKHTVSSELLERVEEKILKFKKDMKLTK